MYLPPTPSHRGVWLVLAGKIGQVRDMITAVSDHGQRPE